MKDNIIQFPLNKEKIYFFAEEYEKYIELREKLLNSIVPGEAIFYKNKIDDMIEIARMKKITK